MKRIFLSFLVVLIVITSAAIGVWYWGIPDEYVSSRIEGLGRDPVTVAVEGFSKGPFFTFEARRIVARIGSDEVVIVEDLSGEMRPWELIKGKAVVDLEGSTYGGIFSGTVMADGTHQDAEMEFSGIDVSDIGYFQKIGFYGKGKLTGTLFYHNGAGELKFTLGNAVLSSVNTGEFSVPMNFFHTVTGALEIESPERLSVRSLTMSGKGIYVRIKGKIVNRHVEMGAEVMPEPSFPGDSLLMLIERFKVSDGYYYIPINTRL